MPVNFIIHTDPKIGKIQVQFDKKIKWLGLNLQEALTLRSLLDQHIDHLMGSKKGTA